MDSYFYIKSKGCLRKMNTVGNNHIQWPMSTSERQNVKCFLAFAIHGISMDLENHVWCEIETKIFKETKVTGDKRRRMCGSTELGSTHTLLLYMKTYS